MDPLMSDPSVPRTRSYKVTVSQECDRKSQSLSENHRRTAAFIPLRLRHCAGDLKPIHPATGLRVLEMPYEILLRDGKVLAPVAVFFLMRDATTAEIIDVQPIESRGLLISEATFEEDFLREVERALAIEST